MDALRREAKGYRAIGDFERAVACYDQLYSDTCDDWISFEYAQCLKKLKRIDCALEISRALYQKNQTFEFNKHLLAWLLYEKYFREFEDTYSSSEVQTLFETALFVTQLVSQDERSPYEIILLRLIKCLKQSTVNTEDQQLTLLELLEFDKLSEIPRKTIRQDKELVFQSDKEMAYGCKTKALFNKRMYSECIACCNEALEKIKSFHHNNDLWIQFRKAVCIGKLEGNESAIRHLEVLLLQKTHWVLFVELAKLYYISGDNKTALYYYCRAAVTSDPPKMKVKLFYDMWKLLEKMDDKINGELHARYVQAIRELAGWAPHRNIEAYFSQKGNTINIQKALNRDLRTFWIQRIQEKLGVYFGTISSDYQADKSGYIETERRRYYFRRTSIASHYNPKAKDRVRFCQIKVYDQRKNREGVEAAFLTLDFGTEK